MINKRKAKVFILFVLASGLIWFLNTLSQTYIANTTIKIDYSNTNSNLKLTKAYTNKLDVKLQTKGFQFLGFNLKKKSIVLDLSEVETINDRYYLAPNIYKSQIEKQLPNSLVLIAITSDTLFFDFLKLISKEVPVQSEIKPNLAHNYLLDGALKIEPETITITGPEAEIDSVKSVHIESLGSSEIEANFTKQVALYKSPKLVNTTFSEDFVQVTGTVSKFSEKMITVAVEVINLPSGTQIRTFPDEVSILCKAKIDQLKALKAADFKVTADYSKLSSNRSNEMQLKLAKKPEGIFDASLMEVKVEYILNKE
ncbi:YbbR-like domain-containing protein [Aurantibacter crassamenti]|uniref:CdaR family protein n=1 Tax=Aurantibacter crassamenti TaxID=1837375 RepID=UPI0019399C01|nr:YbbR-like domain-containing protein [Aurantibacter crassamenti]MBM1107493.1 YbbR-like domain-containing protein [Aurantibacter crassamenti]